MRMIIAFLSGVMMLVMAALGVINIINSNTMNSSDYTLIIIVSFLIFAGAVGSPSRNTTNHE